ncbi:hypothetical protein [uncultured Pseudacidovorax sp.]|uniref:hypothetical protein n=1 Tax=uncultured Pseudacidovorax sp. TaxID=679313 RepID=UPI0025D060E0|nr:hypothetical protein [uncultured Pseudacidovorax sp.]
MRRSSRLTGALAASLGLAAVGASAQLRAEYAIRWTPEHGAPQTAEDVLRILDISD